MRFAARLAYDGTAYQGFQRLAKDVPTIQGVVEAALTTITHHPSRIIGAGRTDSGVHASGQVIAFDMEWQYPLAALSKAINANLPMDVAVGQVLEAPMEFHPRYDALRRTYVYRIQLAPHRDPLRIQQVWHWRTTLDSPAMQAALAVLVGEHDFATFGQPTSSHSSNTVRQVLAADLQHVGDELHITITANAFLQRMMRSIVGTLVQVGRGKMTVVEFEQALSAAERRRSGPAAPPQGLVLTRVEYGNALDQLFTN